MKSCTPLLSFIDQHWPPRFSNVDCVNTCRPIPFCLLFFCRRRLHMILATVDHLQQDSVSEWLRRWTRNPLGSARRGSNPLAVVLVPLAVLQGAKIFCRRRSFWEGCQRDCHPAAWSSGMILVIISIVIDVTKVIHIFIMPATGMVIDRNCRLLALNAKLGRPMSRASYFGC